MNESDELGSQEITPTLASWVLWVSGNESALRPGGFTVRLIQAWMFADLGNARRLAGAFPGLGLAIDTYKNVPGGNVTLGLLAGLTNEY